MWSWDGVKGGGDNWELRFDAYLLPRVKHTASGNLLYSAGPQCSVTYKSKTGGWVRSQMEGIICTCLTVQEM